MSDEWVVAIGVICLWALLLAFLFRGSFNLLRASLELLALLIKVKIQTGKVQRIVKPGGGGWTVVL